MIADLWGLLSGQLGVFPGLPDGVAPDGVPERYQYVGVSAWKALCQVLAKLGLAVAWNLTSYSIVSIGQTDSVTTALLAGASQRLLVDRQYPAIARGRVPAGVRVHFHRVQEHYSSEPATEQDSGQFITSNVYTLDVPGEANGTDGSYHPLWDDLPAVYDPAGNLLNAADLTTRASNRASAYFAMLRGVGGNRRQQVYSGLLAVRPGSILRGVCWGQDLHAITDPEGDAGALITTVATWPTTRRKCHVDYR